MKSTMLTCRIYILTINQNILSLNSFTTQKVICSLWQWFPWLLSIHKLCISSDVLILLDSLGYSSDSQFTMQVKSLFSIATSIFFYTFWEIFQSSFNICRWLPNIYFNKSKHKILGSIWWFHEHFFKWEIIYTHLWSFFR